MGSLTASRTLFDDEHLQLQSTVRTFIGTHVRDHAEEWDRAGLMPKEIFAKAAEAGILGFSIPTEYGGGGSDDFRVNVAVSEEIQRHPISSGLGGITLANDIIIPYFTDLTTEEQKQRWLPGIAAGTSVVAVAMTEPGTGSDLSAISTRAVSDGDDYVVNGSKIFISNGQNADLVVTAVRTGDDPHEGLSLLVIDTSSPGFVRGRNLDKIGLHAQDTSELSFTDVRVPAANRLGEEGEGFSMLMGNLPQERLSIAVSAVASCEGILERTLDYLGQRSAFGRSIGSFQNSRFEMAELTATTKAHRAWIDSLITARNDGLLDPADAAAAKFLTTEHYVDLTSRCLQLHGGYGYMREYRIAQDYEDARVTTIYGGTTEIMKEIVGRSLGL